jgi:ubiquinone/menaquinone biosynthesis C-methylase UbiE
VEQKSYVIRGGIEGRERLRILARVMQPTTNILLNQVGIKQGMSCLDVGCGGGDVSFYLAKLVGSTGRIVGIDIDETKIEIARKEAIENKILNIEFRVSDINEVEGKAEFDIVYARFLLTHLQDPVNALKKIFSELKPGGLVVLEDVDFNGHFCFPENEAFKRYVQLYSEVVNIRGGDPNIGPRLPNLLKETGFEKIKVNVVQPAGIDGEVKMMAAITMENIAHAVMSTALATGEEIDDILKNLYELAMDKESFCSIPRIVQTWAYRA